MCLEADFDLVFRFVKHLHIHSFEWLGYEFEVSVKFVHKLSVLYLEYEKHYVEYAALAVLLYEVAEVYDPIPLLRISVYVNFNFAVS